MRVRVGASQCTTTRATARVSWHATCRICYSRQRFVACSNVVANAGCVDARSPVIVKRTFE